MLRSPRPPGALGFGLAIAVVLFAAMWSCHREGATSERTSAVDCDCCDKPITDPIPPCERSLCENGAPDRCTLREGSAGDACQVAVCAEHPECCAGWWGSDCVAAVHTLCPGVVCPAQCGNGYVESGEQCDDGNTEGHDSCSAACQDRRDVNQCGDGYVDALEDCDRGTNNGSYGSLCTTSCTFGGPRCGDGIVQPEEQCDAGEPPRQAPDDSSGALSDRVCAASCRWQGCGDQVCDDGETTSCPSDCSGGGAGSGDDGDDSDDDDEIGSEHYCCESADDACNHRGDGICQSGCAWGHDPDCESPSPPDPYLCCSDPSDPCGWNGDGICDAACAFNDVDCQVTVPPDAGVGDGSDAGSGGGSGSDAGPDDASGSDAGSGGGSGSDGGPVAGAAAMPARAATGTLVRPRVVAAASRIRAVPGHRQRVSSGRGSSTVMTRRDLSCLAPPILLFDPATPVRCRRQLPGLASARPSGVNPCAENS